MDKLGMHDAMDTTLFFNFLLISSLIYIIQMKENNQYESQRRKNTWIGMKSSSEVELVEDKTKKRLKKRLKVEFNDKKHHGESLFLSHV